MKTKRLRERQTKQNNFKGREEGREIYKTVQWLENRNRQTKQYNGNAREGGREVDKTV